MIQQHTWPHCGQLRARNRNSVFYFSVECLLAVLLVIPDYAGNARSLQANSENAKKKKMKGAYNVSTHCSHYMILL